MIHTHSLEVAHATYLYGRRSVPVAKRSVARVQDSPRVTDQARAGGASRSDMSSTNR